MDNAISTVALVGTHFSDRMIKYDSDFVKKAILKKKENHLIIPHHYSKCK